MGKIIFIVVLFICTFHTNKSQAKSRNIEDYIERANKAIESDIALAQIYIDSCKSITKNIASNPFKSDIYIMQAIVNIQQGKYEEAKYILEKTIIDIKRNNEQSKLAHSHYLIATCFLNINEHIKALDHALIAKSLYESSKNQFMITNCSYIIGSAFFELEQYYIASRHLIQVENYSINNSNNTLLFSCRKKLAEIFMTDSIDNIDNAINYYKLAIKTGENQQNQQYKPLHIDLGKAFLRKGEINKAEKQFLMAESFNADLRDHEKASLYLYLGIINKTKTNFNLAKEYLLKSIDIAQNIKRYENIEKAYNLISEIELINNNSRLALHYLKLANNWNDSANNIEHLNTLNGIKDGYQQKEIAYEQELQKSILAVDKVNLKKNKFIVIFLFGVIFFITIILLIITYLNKKKKATITQLKKANHDLNKKNKQLNTTINTRNTLLSTIGHDIKNPLSSISGFAELLILHADDEDKQQITAYSKQIYNSSNNLITLLDNLIQWAKAQKDNIKTNPARHSIADLVESNIEFLQEMANIKEIKIINNCMYEHKVFADIHMINSAIRNIINNAIKFTSPKGLVTIESELKNNQIHLHIIDTGIGIDISDIPLLFNPEIERKEIGSNAHSNKGTGIGLLLSNEFVKLNNGCIEVKSTLNQGTCFTIRLPYESNYKRA